MKKLSKFLIPLSFMMGLVLINPIHGFADTKTNDVNVIVNPGEFSLSVPAANTFGQLTLKETAVTHKTGFAQTFTIKDLRGSQAGWRLDLSASQFKNAKDTLPLGSVAIKPVKTITRVGTGSGSLPVASQTANAIVDDGAVPIAKAVAKSGMGVFNLTFDADSLSLVLDPTTAIVGNYSSTLTWNLVQAP